MTTPKKASTLIKEKELPNYLLIKFGYDAEYVLPYDKGIKILALFNEFEMYDTSDYQHAKITYSKLDKNISVRVLSGKEYIDLKAKALLRVENES